MTDHNPPTPGIREWGWVPTGTTNTYGIYATQKRADDWIAYETAEHGNWEAGRTEAEALGKLFIRQWHEQHPTSERGSLESLRDALSTTFRFLDEAESECGRQEACTEVDEARKWLSRVVRHHMPRGYEPPEALSQEADDYAAMKMARHQMTWMLPTNGEAGEGEGQ